MTGIWACFSEQGKKPFSPCVKLQFVPKREAYWENQQQHQTLHLESLGWERPEKKCTCLDTIRHCKANLYKEQSLQKGNFNYLCFLSKYLVHLFNPFLEDTQSVNLSNSLSFGTQIVSSTNNVCLNAITANKSRTSFLRFYIPAIFPWIFCLSLIPFSLTVSSHAYSLATPEIFGNFLFE